MKRQLTHWERLEEWLIDHDTETFTVYDIASDMGIPVQEASYLIQNYLTAQRNVEPRTLYVLKREGRTKAAVWSVGQRTADARMIGKVLFTDIRVKVQRAWKPDLDRLREKNPAAARYVESKLVAVTDGALKMLAVALDAEGDYDDEEVAA